MKESNSTTSRTPQSKQQSSLRTLAISSLGLRIATDSQDCQSTETCSKKDVKTNGINNHHPKLQLKQQNEKLHKMEEANGNGPKSFHSRDHVPLPHKQKNPIVNKYKESKLQLINEAIGNSSDFHREKENEKQSLKSVTAFPNDDTMKEKSKDNEKGNHQVVSMEEMNHSNSVTNDCNQEKEKLDTSFHYSHNINEKTTSKHDLLLSETELGHHESKRKELKTTIITGSSNNNNNNYNVSNDQDLSNENQTTEGDDNSTGENNSIEETKDEKTPSQHDDPSESDTGSSDLEEEEDEGLSQYELLRLRKIKRNQERMKQLGLFNLSMNMKKQPETPKMTTPTPKKAKRKTPMEVTPRTLPRRKARDNVMFPYGEDGQEQDMNTPHRGEKSQDPDNNKPKPPKLFRMYTPMNQKLTRMLQKGGKMRRFRCQRCAACQKTDCGKCAHCKDKRKFGGPDKLRQACLLRQKCEEWLMTELVEADQGLGIYDNVLEVLWGYGRIETCSVCHIGGDLLKCNECKQSIHLRCNVVADDNFIHLSRSGKWTCHRCTSRIPLQKKDDTKDSTDAEVKNKTIAKLKSETPLNVETMNSKVSSIDTETKSQSDTNNMSKESVGGSNVQQADKDTSNKNICIICNVEGASGTCGYCGKMFHDYCHIPSLSFMKPGKLKCMICVAPIGQRRTRCGQCVACCRPDCGECTYCLDKPKFGGKSLKRKPCKQRKCQHKSSKMSRLGYRALTTNQVITLPPHLATTTSTPFSNKNENHNKSIDTNDNKIPVLAPPKILTPKEESISGDEKHVGKEVENKKEEDKDDKNQNSNEIVKEDFPIEQEFYDDKNSDVCQICKKTGNLICCDKCPRSFHSKCLGVDEKDLPEDYWECRFCKDDVVAKSDEIMLGEKSFGEVNWAFSSLIEANHADLVYSKMLIVSKIYELLDFLMQYDFGDIFATPVVNVPGYRKIISRPMDLGTIQKNIMKGVYYRNAIRSYSSESKRAIFDTAGDEDSSHGVIDVAILDILKDIETVWHNCFVFNLEDSVYFRMAQVQRRKHIALITSTFYDHLDSYVVNELSEFVNDCRLFEKLELEEEKEEQKLEKEKNDSDLTKTELLEKILKTAKRKKQKNRLSMPRKRHVVKTKKDIDELEDDKPLSKFLKEMKHVKKDTASESKSGRKRRRNKSEPETPKKKRKRKLKDIEVNETGESAGLSEEPKPRKRGRPRKSELKEIVTKKHIKPRKSDLNIEGSSNKLMKDEDSPDIKSIPKFEKVIINREKLNIIASSRKHILKTLTPNNILHNMATKVIDVVLASVEAINNNGEKPRTIIFNQEYFFNEYTKVRQIKKSVERRNKKIMKKEEGSVSRSRKGLKRKGTVKDTRVEDLVFISQKI